MADYQITCCSTADMPEEFFIRRNIKYVCFHFTMDGVQYADDLGHSMSFDEFYKRIEGGAMPTTSQVNVDEFINFFEPMLKEGKDILHLSFSSGISGEANSAQIAVGELRARYPERKILALDTLTASGGYGLLIDAVADKRDAGATIEEAYNWARDNRLKVHHWFFSTDLTHFKRGGRISATSAVLGNIFNICPLMNMNYEGKLIPREKIRTKKAVINRIVKKMEECADDGLDYSGKCFITNSACPEDARAVASLIEEKFKKLNGKVMINSIGTVIGSHTGCGTVALFFFGKERID